MTLNMIGAYGPFAAAILGEGPARLSYLNPCFEDLESWRTQARSKALELIAPPDNGGTPEVEVVERNLVDGVEAEILRWQLPYGPPTEAVLLKPEGACGPLPGILALHDHSGDKYFGYRKIAHDGRPVHPVMRVFQACRYAGRAWANEIARRGYVVLCPDGHAFGSRRMRVADVPDVLRHPEATDVGEEENGFEINAYNLWADRHENIMAKSFFSAGTTWPGVCLAEDQRALDVLCSRPEVDADRIGCGGLSGGGLRTVYLGGLDDRVRAAVCVALMTTWRDYVLNNCWTYTWMMHSPLLPRYLDFPEILGLRVPLPTMVLNNSEDELFTPAEVRRADGILRAVYDKAGAADRYVCSFHPGLHKFDIAMQEEAFAWFDRWLKP